MLIPLRYPGWFIHRSGIPLTPLALEAKCYCQIVHILQLFENRWTNMPRYASSLQLYRHKANTYFKFRVCIWSFAALWTVGSRILWRVYTDKRENKIFLVYEQIKNAKSYMTNGLLICGEIFSHFLIYYKALPHIWICNCSSLNFLIYEENSIWFFISVHCNLFRLN